MNYLTPLTVMAARLRAKLPESVLVRTAVDMAQVEDESAGNPEVWVVFHRDIVKDAAESSTLLEVQLAAIYLAPGVLPDLARDGDTLTAVTKALAGYDPYKEHGIDGLEPFHRVGSMVPQTWQKSRLVAYGMLFSTEISL